jgi:hypothetical protein
MESSPATSRPCAAARPQNYNRVRRIRDRGSKGAPDRVSRCRTWPGCHFWTGSEQFLSKPGSIRTWPGAPGGRPKHYGQVVDEGCDLRHEARSGIQFRYTGPASQIPCYYAEAGSTN